MIAQTRFHHRGEGQAPVNATEIVVYKVKIDLMFVVAVETLARA
jgi:hypothetical protein